MTPDDIVRYTSQALLTCMLISLPAVACSAVVGMVVAFFQAITSLQDASIAYAIKLLSVSVAIVISAPWAGAQLLHFSASLLQVAFRQ